MRVKPVLRYMAILGIACWIAPILQGQAYDEVQSGNIKVIQNERIERLLEKHIQLNALFPEIDGYRVQVYFDSGNTSKSRAFEVYKNFMTAYPGHMAYVVYHEPNYKVRVGDFRTRIEAEGFLRQILVEYPSAFVIKDKILFPTLEAASTE